MKAFALRGGIVLPVLLFYAEEKIEDIEIIEPSRGKLKCRQFGSECKQLVRPTVVSSVTSKI